MTRELSFLLGAALVIVGCEDKAKGKPPSEKEAAKVASGLAGIGQLADKKSAEPEPSAAPSSAGGADDPKLWDAKPTPVFDEAKYNTLIDIRIQEARECHRKPDPEKLTVDIEADPPGRVKVKLSGNAYETGDKACIESHFKLFSGPPFEGTANKKHQRHGFLYKQDKKNGE